jgi:hypothetical protein
VPVRVAESDPKDLVSELSPTERMDFLTVRLLAPFHSIGEFVVRAKNAHRACFLFCTANADGSSSNLFSGTSYGEVPIIPIIGSDPVCRFRAGCGAHDPHVRFADLSLNCAGPREFAVNGVLGGISDARLNVFRPVTVLARRHSRIS